MATVFQDNLFQKQESKSNIFWSIFWFVLIVMLLLKFFVYQQVAVVGASMEPNYFTGELLLVNQIDKNIERGQVVAVYEDKEVAKNADYWTRFQTRFFLKRVIGLPGEEVEMVGDAVIIYNSNFPSGKVLVEDYISQDVKNKEKVSNYYFPRTKIAEKNYFILGDNRINSKDSRMIGTFPDYSIFGQETLRFWPVEKLGMFSLHKYEYSDVSSDLQASITEAKKRLIS